MPEEAARASPVDGPGPAGVDPTRPFRTTLRALATVVAPTSLVTSLLFYFGWVRTSNQALDMGLHDSLFGYSTRDYVLRSIDPMRGPLVVGILAALGGLALHVWLLGWAREGPPPERTRRLRLLTHTGGIAGAASVVLGVVGYRTSGGAELTGWTRAVYVASPLLVTVGVVLGGYSLHVRRRFLLARPRRTKAAAEVERLRLVISSLIVLLLLLSLFWSVYAYAVVKGHDLAAEIERDLPTFPEVTIYSAKRLQLQPPVEEADLGDTGAAYRFRYTGLTLIVRSGGRLFLRPSDGTRLNIVIPDSGDLRFEFARG
jgi:hypothetical protein